MNAASREAVKKPWRGYLRHILSSWRRSPVGRRIGSHRPDSVLPPIVADAPWRQVRDLGNPLRHAYDKVDLEIIRQTITGA
jgi:hypothetical protein